MQCASSDRPWEDFHSFLEQNIRGQTVWQLFGRFANLLTYVCQRLPPRSPQSQGSEGIAGCALFFILFEFDYLTFELIAPDVPLK